MTAEPCEHVFKTNLFPALQEKRREKIAFPSRQASRHRTVLTQKLRRNNVHVVIHARFSSRSRF